MFRVVGIGELLWDLLPTGAQIGGAPANYAYHAGALGAEARAISRVGADALGRELISQLDVLGVSTQYVQVDDALPTGTVAVEIDGAGQPHYHITAAVAWDHLQVTPDALMVASSADAICFGTLAQRNVVARDAIRALVAASPSDALRILDVNLRQHYFSPALIDESLMLATVLKVNDVELPQLAAMFGLTGSEHAQMVQIAERWQLRAVALTRGDKGSALLTQQAWSEHPGVRVVVADTIGAGDAFTAAMTLGLLQGWSLDDVNAQANLVAAYVSSQPGGTPALPADVSAAFVGTR
jgi:fructokinase